ncbi:MAG TPA: hypothetical protein VME01_04035, partial [Solirubrobacteraceae bacterium]|nr:hypothetical protein [Solirubrobacteraceae bacterium]
MSLKAFRRCLSTLVAVALFLLSACALAVPAASAQTQILGLHGWQVQSSANVPQGGAQVSLPGFDSSSWLHVKPDAAGAVGTEVEALVQNGRCPNVFYSDNMQVCFGQMSVIGPDTLPLFSVPWWFRTGFQATPASSTFDLAINGVVGEADVWVNGHEVATHRTVEGDYTRFQFDITSLVRLGLNTLALELYPNDPNTMFTLDNVDWTQI